MSEDAKTLLHYASNSTNGCADDSDRGYCAQCARVWAMSIIAQSSLPDAA